jgi:serine protease AprX
MKTASKAFPSTSIATDPATGQIYTSQYDVFTVGAGYLDIAAALNNTDVLAGPAFSPRAVYDPATHRVHLQGGAMSGSTIVWDDNIVWGDSMVWGDTIVWGNTIVWGDAVLGQTIVWGDTLVWGDGVSQGFTLVWGDSLIWGTSTTPSGESTNVAINGEN